MPTVLTTNAVEEGTFIITAAFTDENDEAVVPNAGLSWTLTDSSGNVINNRSSVAIDPASSVDIVLSDGDLAITDEQDLTRYLLVEGTYDSDAGSDLPLKDQVRFQIVNLRGVS